METEFLESIELIYEAGLRPERWNTAMQSMNRLVNAPGSHLVLADTESGIPVAGFLEGFPVEANQEYIDYYAQYDERWPRIMAIPHGQIHMTPQFISTEEQRSSVCYNDFLVRYDGENQAVARFDVTPSLFVILAKIRSNKAEVMSGEDLALFRHLLPHVQRAILINTKLADMDLFATSAGDRVDALPFGVVFLDEQAGGVVFSNRAAKRIFNDGDGLICTTEGIASEYRPDNERLQRLIGAAIRGPAGSGGAMTLLRRSGRRPYAATVAPLPRNKALFGSMSPLAVVFLTDPEQRPVALPEVLRGLFGLTPREAELATQLAGGTSLDVAAECLAITRETARRHLKSLFRKTGTSRQAELVRLLLLSLPANDDMKPSSST